MYKPPHMRTAQKRVAASSDKKALNLKFALNS